MKITRHRYTVTPEYVGQNRIRLRLSPAFHRSKSFKRNCWRATLPQSQTRWAYRSWRQLEIRIGRRLAGHRLPSSDRRYLAVYRHVFLNTFKKE
jgi:hypothetical protein